jgi:hypothetical protein
MRDTTAAQEFIKLSYARDPHRNIPTGGVAVALAGVAPGNQPSHELDAALGLTFANANPSLGSAQATRCVVLCCVVVSVVLLYWPGGSFSSAKLNRSGTALDLASNAWVTARGAVSKAFTCP